MHSKNRAALYLRVSTADQKPDLQFDGLRAYAERAELEIVRDYLDEVSRFPAGSKVARSSMS